MQTTGNRQTAELVRGLGLWACSAVVVGAMIGQSIFLVTSQVARMAGSVGWVLATWLIGGVLVLFATFCFAELGAALPRAGGEYVYLGRGLGPIWGFLFGWTSALLIGPAIAATIAAGLVRITAFLAPSISVSIFSRNIPNVFQLEPYRFTFSTGQIWAAVAIVALTAVNYVGVRAAGVVQVLVTGLKVSGIVVLIVWGLTAENVGGMQIDAANPAVAYGGIGVFLTTLVPVMLAYNGFQSLGHIGGEIKDPQRTVPRAAILGVLTVVILYFLLNLVYLRVLGLPLVARSQHVASDVGMQLGGAIGARWLTIIMMLSALGSLHVNVLGRPRILYAMARDGEFFSFASRIQPVFRTPSGALLFHACVAVLLVLTGTYEELYSLVVFCIWIFTALTAWALIRLRQTEPALFRPYRAWGYPWTAVIVVAVGVAMSANQLLARPGRSLMGFVVILLGVPFFNYWRKRAANSSG